MRSESDEEEPAWTRPRLLAAQIGLLGLLTDFYTALHTASDPLYPPERAAMRDVRVCLVGDEGVGKSSIISALIKCVRALI